QTHLVLTYKTGLRANIEYIGVITQQSMLSAKNMKNNIKKGALRPFLLLNV
ncbi:ATP-dependent protease ATP-binding subunit, partial [Moritella sp. PE36]